MKVEPVFGCIIHTDICVAFEFKSEGRVRCDSGTGYVSSGKAAIDNDAMRQLQVRSIGMPSCISGFRLSRFIIVIIMHVL